MMRKIKSTMVVLGTCWIFTGAGPVDAKEENPDRFKISLGSYTLARYESEMALMERNTGAGISINPEDTLGLETEQTVFRLDGYYRFNPKHSLIYSWYSISTDGNKRVDQEIDWVDENGNPITIPVGARVDTRLDYDIYKLSYRWTFHHTDKVQLAAGLGLHVTKIAVGLEAETTSSGVDAKNVSVTAPLPVLSFNLRYNVTPKLDLYLTSEFFSMEVQEWSGAYNDNALGIEYRILKNVGLGVGLASNSFKLSRETEEYKFVYANRISGLALYVSGHF